MKAKVNENETSRMNLILIELFGGIGGPRSLTVREREREIGA